MIFRFFSNISDITLLEWHNLDGWWFGILGIEWMGEDTGHLFFVEHTYGEWKFDFFFYRLFVNPFSLNRRGE